MRTLMTVLAAPHQVHEASRPDTRNPSMSKDQRALHWCENKTECHAPERKHFCRERNGLVSRSGCIRMFSFVGHANSPEKNANNGRNTQAVDYVSGDVIVLNSQKEGDGEIPASCAAHI